jgi:hypothetical protein
MPLSRWSSFELAREAIEAGIVVDMSASTVARCWPPTRSSSGGTGSRSVLDRFSIVDNDSSLGYPAHKIKTGEYPGRGNRGGSADPARSQVKKGMKAPPSWRRLLRMSAMGPTDRGHGTRAPARPASDRSRVAWRGTGLVRYRC